MCDPASLRPEDDTRATSSIKRLRTRGYIINASSLLEALQSTVVAVRAEAAFLIGYNKEASALDGLRQSLEDNSARVRVEVALALARLGNVEDAIHLLYQELKGEFFEDAPLRAARALALLNIPLGYSRVMEALVSPYPSNRMEALAVLPAFLCFTGQEVEGQTIDPVEALILATSDSDRTLRRDALAILAETADPRAKMTIETALADSDSEVREFAQRLLLELRSSERSLDREKDRGSTFF
jgi:HEAT repeat protein